MIDENFLDLELHFWLKTKSKCPHVLSVNLHESIWNSMLS